MDAYRDSRDEQIKELTRQVSELKSKLSRDDKHRRKQIRKFARLVGYGMAISALASIAVCLVTWMFCLINGVDGRGTVIANALLISMSAGAFFSLLIGSCGAENVK